MNRHVTVSLACGVTYDTTANGSDESIRAYLMGAEMVVIRDYREVTTFVTGVVVHPCDHAPWRRCECEVR